MRSQHWLRRQFIEASFLEGAIPFGDCPIKIRLRFCKCFDPITGKHHKPPWLSEFMSRCPPSIFENLTDYLITDDLTGIIFRKNGSTLPDEFIYLFWIENCSHYF